jgi:aminopeptidase-like protein
MIDADGEKDLLAIADGSALPIEAYDDAVQSFLSAGLIEEIDIKIK